MLHTKWHKTNQCIPPRSWWMWRRYRDPAAGDLVRGLWWLRFRAAVAANGHVSKSWTVQELMVLATGNRNRSNRNKRDSQRSTRRWRNGQVRFTWSAVVYDGIFFFLEPWATRSFEPGSWSRCANLAVIDPERSAEEFAYSCSPERQPHSVSPARSIVRGHASLRIIRLCCARCGPWFE